jgi:drug/metabolite transporter (DMT)-like permease
VRRAPVLFAVLAAVCYGISAPAAKLLLGEMSPTMMAALLYLGAGFGMAAVRLLRRKQTLALEARITPGQTPFVIAMIALDIAAPILLMLGLSSSPPESASLLNNFEIVATTVIAIAVFKEAVGKRMWLAIAFITAASVILAVPDFRNLRFSPGSVYILLACVCWGFENNCTRMLSLNDPLQIVVIKGIGSGIGAFLIAVLTGGLSSNAVYITSALLLGFVSYGLSIYFYILAQRNLGAARTSAFYAVAPFVGVGLSFLLFRTPPAFSFWIALAVMAAGAYLAVIEKHDHGHTHHAMEHDHRHNHTDGHHSHPHPSPAAAEHSHVHTHSPITHSHPHSPDTHHRHRH